MGSADPRAYSRNKRGIAGSLIWINFDRHALLDVFRKARGRFVANIDDIRPQFRPDSQEFLDQTAIFQSALTRSVGPDVAGTINQLDLISAFTPGLSLSPAGLPPFESAAIPDRTMSLKPASRAAFDAKSALAGKGRFSSEPVSGSRGAIQGAEKHAAGKGNDGGPCSPLATSSELPFLIRAAPGLLPGREPLLARAARGRPPLPAVFGRQQGAEIREVSAGDGGGTGSLGRRWVRDGGA